jgi:hypothetical protein
MARHKLQVCRTILMKPDQPLSLLPIPPRQVILLFNVIHPLSTPSPNLLPLPIHLPLLLPPQLLRTRPVPPRMRKTNPLKFLSADRSK